MKKKIFPAWHCRCGGRNDTSLSPLMDISLPLSLLSSVQKTLCCHVWRGIIKPHEGSVSPAIPMLRHGGGDTWPEVPERENLCKVSILFLNLESVLYLNPDLTIGAQLGGVGEQHLSKADYQEGELHGLRFPRGKTFSKSYIY